MWQVTGVFPGVGVVWPQSGGEAGIHYSTLQYITVLYYSPLQYSTTMCVCVCGCTWVHVGAHGCMLVHVGAHGGMDVHVWGHVWECVGMCGCVWSCVGVCMCACVSVHVCVHVLCVWESGIHYSTLQYITVVYYSTLQYSTTGLPADFYFNDCMISHLNMLFGTGKQLLHLYHSNSLGIVRKTPKSVYYKSGIYHCKM